MLFVTSLSRKRPSVILFFVGWVTCGQRNVIFNQRWAADEAIIAFWFDLILITASSVNILYVVRYRWSQTCWVIALLSLNSFFPPQFLQRQKILGIYREMLKTIRQVPNEGDRKYLQNWARDEFKRNKNATNQVRVWMCFTFHYIVRLFYCSAVSVVSILSKKLL